MKELVGFIFILIISFTACKNQDERMICKEQCLHEYPCIDAIEYDKGHVCTVEKKKRDTNKRDSCYDSCGFGFSVPHF